MKWLSFFVYLRLVKWKGIFWDKNEKQGTKRGRSQSCKVVDIIFYI